MIIAIAGRRVDATDAADTRFPLQNVELVRKRVRSVLEDEMVTATVSAAACGADLIALTEARDLRLRRKVILPFDRARFRETSVADRPGDWGPIYDRVLDQVDAQNDLVILDVQPNTEGYRAANNAILDAAVSLARESDQLAGALIIWDGASRGSDDITQQFADEAKKRGLEIIEVKTI